MRSGYILAYMNVAQVLRTRERTQPSRSYICILRQKRKDQQNKCQMRDKPAVLESSFRGQTQPRSTKLLPYVL